MKNKFLKIMLSIAALEPIRVEVSLLDQCIT